MRMHIGTPDHMTKLPFPSIHSSVVSQLTTTWLVHLLLWSFHPEDANGSGWKVWVTFTSHPDFTVKPSSSPSLTTTTTSTFWSSCHQSSIHLHNISTCFYSLCLLPPTSFTFLHPSILRWINSPSISRNTSGCVSSHSHLLLSIQPPDRRRSLILTSCLTGGKLCYKDSETENISHLLALMHSPFLFRLLSRSLSHSVYNWRAALETWGIVKLVPCRLWSHDDRGMLIQSLHLMLWVYPNKPTSLKISCIYICLGNKNKKWNWSRRVTFLEMHSLVFLARFNPLIPCFLTAPETWCQNLD